MMGTSIRRVAVLWPVSLSKVEKQIQSLREDIIEQKETDLIAGDVMNENVIPIGSDLSLGQAATFLVDNQISGAPVRDPDGKIVGVLSVTDIVGVASDHNANLVESARRAAGGWESALTREDLDNLSFTGVATTVEDIMTPTVYTIPIETPLQEISRTMIAGRIHRLFVTEHDAIVGIITTLDLLKVLARWDG